MYAIGLDIGGTKIAASLVDQKGTSLYRNEKSSIRTESEMMFRQVTECVEKVLEDSGVPLQHIKGIGAGIPGKVDVQKGVAVYQNNLPWRRFPFKQRLEDIFQVDVKIDNDVRMAAYGEWVVTGANHKETFVYLTWSTGIACCLIHQGNFIKGGGFAGEVGLAYFNEVSERLETCVSGPAISKKASSTSRQSITTKEIVHQFKDGNLLATNIMNPVLKEFARGVYSIICLIDPHKLIFGGSVITHNPFLLDSIKKELSHMVIKEQHSSLDNLYVSILKGDAGLIGAGLSILADNNASDNSIKIVKGEA